MIRSFFLVLSMVLLLVLHKGPDLAAQVDNGILKKADKAFVAQLYRPAAELYIQVVQQQPKHKQANYKLGICFLELNEPAKACKYLLAAYKLDPLVAEDLLFALADAYQLNGEFEEAITFFRKELARAPRIDMDNINYLQKRIYECESGLALAQEPPVAEITNLGQGINSVLSDYVPVLLPGDTVMLFTTRSQQAEGGSTPEAEQIHVSHLKGGVWQSSTPFLKAGAKLPNHAVVSMAPHGQELYTYYSGKGGGLFSSKRKGSGWSDPVRLGKPFNMGSSELSMHITDDDKFAFFSSNREGGYGGLDLYVCFKKPDGTWSDALNLGPNINTSYDEDAPYVDVQTNTLYFSSRGHNSIGGFDIFKAVIRNSEWSKAQNMGIPVNSPSDDLYFALNKNPRIAYFSSDRPKGYGAKDIYHIKFISR